jgi:hypothetical protein
MNGWRSRLGIALLIVAAMSAHSYSMGGATNSPIGMLVFHGSAALVDFALLLATPYWLVGKLCDDTETLMLLSIIGNAMGWGLYMAYAPPVFYDVCMYGLSIAQWLRLLYVDDHDSISARHGLVHGNHLRRSHIYSKA